MKKFTVYYLLLLALVFNFSSCKDEDEDTATPSKQELLTAKTWKLDKFITGGVDLTKNPLLAAFLPQTYTFKSDKTYSFTSALGPDTGTWEFASNETIIVTDAGTADELRWALTELNANSLKATVTDPTDNTQYQAELIPAP